MRWYEADVVGLGRWLGVGPRGVAVAQERVLDVECEWLDYAEMDRVEEQKQCLRLHLYPRVVKVRTRLVF